MIKVSVDKICITQGDTDWSTKKGGVFAIHVVCDDRYRSDDHVMIRHVTLTQTTTFIMWPNHVTNNPIYVYSFDRLLQ